MLNNAKNRAYTTPIVIFKYPYSTPYLHLAEAIAKNQTLSRANSFNTYKNTYKILL